VIRLRLADMLRSPAERTKRACTYLFDDILARVDGPHLAECRKIEV